MKVDELWRYPVKSMIGQRVDEVEVDTSASSVTGAGPPVTWSVVASGERRRSAV